MHLKIAVLAGDYIGPEVMDAALPVLETVLKRAGHTLEHSAHPVGGAGIDAAGKALPDATLDAARAADAILFGSVGGPKWEHLPPAEQPERAALLPLRKHFKLFANLRPGFLPAALAGASPIRAERIPAGIDMVCVRELTGGLYFGKKGTTTPAGGDTEAFDTMVYRKSEIERVTDVAVAAARSRGKRLLSVDKANVLECSVLWRRVVSERVAATAPDITLSHMYVDAAAMQLVRDPASFDVLLTENMFGDILSDEMAVVCGSLGMLSSASLGADKNRHGFPFGLYEPAGGSAPDIAGKNLANPSAQLLSAALMLRHSFGLNAEADVLAGAVNATVAAGIRTADIAFGAPAVGTREFAAEVLRRLG
ncbi:MAG: 3-isopropylmalate dehydrogenase [Puniceicoccales bacterium]|jgi:3-isopropylmalate dehydrogenase|nr:3-isopropylmalate dehydrogenase [Puniceicoccales bacterium]